MAERLIYADLLRKNLDKTIEHIAKKQGGTEEGSFAVGMCLAFKTMINEQPTIEAKPVVHAHWNQIANGFMVCSHCEEPVEENRKYSFCPLCGAQMDESISCSHEDDTPFSQTHENGVKIPVISMEDVPKIMEEMD